MNENKLNKSFWDEFEKKGTKIVFEMPEFNDLVDRKFVKELRKDLGFSQQVFANSIGVSKKAIEKWEQGVNPVLGPTARLLYLINDDNEIMSRIYKSYIAKPNLEKKKISYNNHNFRNETVFLLGENTVAYIGKSKKDNEFVGRKGDNEWRNLTNYHPSTCLDTIYRQ